MKTNYLIQSLLTIDKRISDFMDKWGVKSLCLSLGLIFIWFGMHKPMGISPAETLVLSTVSWMPFFNPRTWLNIIGYWEVLIGLTFLYKPTIRIAIALLFMQMFGTFLPLIILPELTFQQGLFPYGLTMEGQYIVKNLLIISSALVIGGSVRK